MTPPRTETETRTTPRVLRIDLSPPAAPRTALSLHWRVSRRAFDQAQPGLLPAATDGDVILRCDIDKSERAARFTIEHDGAQIEWLRLAPGSVRLDEIDGWTHADADVLRVSQRGDHLFARVDAVESLGIKGGRMIGPTLTDD